MKKALVILTCALGVNGAFLASTAFAQQASAPVATASGTVSTSGAERETRVEQRIASLHSQLKITPDQEGKWNAFADVMRENGKTMVDMSHQRVAAASGQSALDNMKQYASLVQAHADGVRKLVNAFEPLYNSLSPEQKKLADATFREHMGEHHHPVRGAKQDKPVQQ
ncbi:MAG TPA: Spy/CpxP family protein refolding chaperone [Trinickia sp.]|nr:Spy/CpxP family protein refolding chaperone [Trinickia sp.]